MLDQDYWAYIQYIKRDYVRLYIYRNPKSDKKKSSVSISIISMLCIYKICMTYASIWSNQALIYNQAYTCANVRVYPFLYSKFFKDIYCASCSSWHHTRCLNIRTIVNYLSRYFSIFSSIMSLRLHYHVMKYKKKMTTSLQKYSKSCDFTISAGKDALND